MREWEDGGGHDAGAEGGTVVTLALAFAPETGATHTAASDFTFDADVTTVGASWIEADDGRGGRDTGTDGETDGTDGCEEERTFERETEKTAEAKEGVKEEG